MFNPTHAKQDLAAHQDAIRVLSAKGVADLTPEEAQSLDDHCAKAEKTQADIDRHERAMKLAPVGSQPGNGQPHPPAQVHDNREDAPFTGPFPLGQQLRAVINSTLAMRSGGEIDPRLRKLAETRAATGMGEAVPTDGGFFVQKPMSDTILQRTYDTGGLIARCRRYPVPVNANGVKLPGVDESSRADGSRIGGIRGYWLDEGGTLTPSKPKFYMVELTLNKVGAVVYLTDELVQDAALLETFVMDRVPEELRFKVEDAIINGDGSGKPLGVLNAGCVVSQAKETGQAAATFVYENAVKMWSRMHAPSRSRAAWFVNQDVEPQLYTMSLAVGTGGAPVYMPAGGASAAPFATLFNRPIVPLEYCATLGTVGDVIFGDFGEYYLIDKGGIQSASSIHVQFLTDQQVLRFIYRVDGEPVWKDALTPFKGGASNARSPFVTLATR